MEELLHYVWKHKIFPLNELTTTTGQRLEIIDTGLSNRDAGPDFFNAKIKLDGVVWVGNIEIHTPAHSNFSKCKQPNKQKKPRILNEYGVILLVREAGLEPARPQ